MPGQPTPAEGNALYAEARRRAIARTGDPQGARRAAPPPADPARPCSCTRADPAVHNGYWHHLTDKGRRTYCTVGTAAGTCPCQIYRPEET